MPVPSKTLEQDYIKRGGTECVSCHSDHLEIGSPQIDGPEVSVNVLCLDCESQWDDVYELQSISNCIGFDPKDPAVTEN